ncbi:cornifin-B-like [Crotalus tigris]|uniref:cornifin-B-like n=1 Tax=Crotalus tigris TaxID=88082 RepID=UPI00192F7ED1|nr:cornifin-B-like [Crotalus tigris]
MAYQCKEPCLPPPTDVVQCVQDTKDPCMAYQCKEPCLPPPTKDPCTLTNTAQCVPSCDCTCSEACNAPDSLSYQAKQPCAAPSFGAPLCLMVTSIPCALPCTSLHTEFCAESPSIPCGSMTPQPCSEDPQPCSLATPGFCTPPSPPTCGSGCSDNCSDPQGDGRMSYVPPGSTVCLEPCGSVSVKPSVASPELENSSIFLASYKPHYM